RTIDLSRTIHSLHGYFLRPGNPEKTIIYDVDRIRDGGSFTTRRVIAKQSGNAIYSCELSFMLPSAGVAHQENMPTLWSEDDINQLESETQFNARMQTTYPNKFKPEPNIFTEWDIRRIHRVDPFSPEPSPPLKEYWLKYNTPLPIKSENNSSTDYFLQHQTLLAYISDMGL